MPAGLPFHAQRALATTCSSQQALLLSSSGPHAVKVGMRAMSRSPPASSSPLSLQANGSGCLLAAGGAAAPALQMADLLIAPLWVVARQLVLLAQQQHQPLLRLLRQGVEAEAAEEGEGEQAAQRMLLLLPLSAAEQSLPPPASAAAAAAGLHAATPALVGAAALPAVALKQQMAGALPGQRRSKWDRDSRGRGRSGSSSSSDSSRGGSRGSSPIQRRRGHGRRCSPSAGRRQRHSSGSRGQARERSLPPRVGGSTASTKDKPPLLDFNFWVSGT